MPLISSFTDNLIVKRNDGILDNPINEKAHVDFCELVKRSGLGYRLNVKHITLYNSKESYIADCFVLGANAKDKGLKVPKDCIVREDKAYVAVVVYADDSVEDVCLFPVHDIKNKKGLFSIYKYLKKEDAYFIKLPNKKKLSNYTFGLVLKDYINQ